MEGTIVSGECPKCHHWDIVGDSFDVEGMFVYQNMNCSKCGFSWCDEYKLVKQIDREGYPLKGEKT